MKVEMTYRSAELLRDLCDTTLAGRGTGNKYTDDSIRAAQDALNDAIRDERLASELPRA